MDPNNYTGERVRFCEDGKYRWTHPLDLKKNPTILILVYKLFGISETHFGEQYGWAANSDYYDGPIEFRNTETVTEHGEKMLVIEIFTYPMECWMEV